MILYIKKSQQHFLENLVVMKCNFYFFFFFPVLVLHPKEVGVLLIRSLSESSFLPQLWGQEGVCVFGCLESSLDEVTHGLGGTSGASVHVFDTSHLKNLLRGHSGDNSRSLWCRNQTDGDGTALSVNLGWDGVHLSDLVTPVSSSDRDHGELGRDDSTANGGGDFLGALDTQTQVTVLVTDDDESLEPGALSGTSLLLNWHDFHHLVLQARSEEVVNDLVLLDRHGEEVDLLEGLDLSALYESSELSARDPSVLVFSLSTSTSTSASTSASTTSVSKASSESATSSFWFWCRVSHGFAFVVSFFLHTLSLSLATSAALPLYCCALKL